ncbi:oxygenase MpaB family protein [Mesonia aestuariivivens]|uniref:DUF2236 domain-containing protein n=1 Tax=Mesonia aestuariivivens TaxID=2796128 RepID=A0ABS6VZ56_9FLAO|nr:oxygenase MpaB family protein [Mesonia aestuariivivens]MBW2960873.1 DUF2236 domain-containing protein [Mesonia aestuariivivens]
MKTYFVLQDSIVYKIWGKADTVMFIFAGAAAKFALNIAVDWLYFTGKLPSDPLGRLLSTVNYAKVIIFAEEKTAIQAIQQMNHIHHKVEEKRGFKIPDWAYRDVLFMLIDYSICAYESLERKLTSAEKEEAFYVFNRVGKLMQISELPKSFDEWEKQRKLQLQENFAYSDYTRDLFLQYKKHLEVFRYRLVLEVQTLMAPKPIKKFLNFRAYSLLKLIIPIYILSELLKIDAFFKAIILPNAYKVQIKALDHQPN